MQVNKMIDTLEMALQRIEELEQEVKELRIENAELPLKVQSKAHSNEDGDCYLPGSLSSNSL